MLFISLQIVLGICAVLMASSIRVTPTLPRDPPGLVLQGKQHWRVRMGGVRQTVYSLGDYWSTGSATLFSHHVYKGLLLSADTNKALEPVAFRQQRSGWLVACSEPAILSC